MWGGGGWLALCCLGHWGGSMGGEGACPVLFGSLGVMGAGG